MEYIIILGNSDVKILNKRVDTAVNYFLSNSQAYYDYTLEDYIPIRKFILSGTLLEVQSMNDYIKEKWNFEEKYIILESQSKNTIDNIKNSMAIIDDKELNPLITLCTSSFHIKRTFVLAHYYLHKTRLNFIHTQEPITKDQFKRESEILNNFLNYKTGLKNNFNL